MGIEEKNQCIFQLIATGGTIDSYYDIDQCTVLPHKESIIPAYLHEFADLSAERFEFNQLCMKDSREVTDFHLDLISKAVMDSACHCHIVTHGTFTLFAHARDVRERLPEGHGQVVVFTGSMWPLKGFSPTDAGFNLGTAISGCQLLDPGVYVAFKGKIFQADDIECLHP